jgi:hypothetical protein
MTRPRWSPLATAALAALVAALLLARTAAAGPPREVRADPSPAVWIDTMATEGGRRGIRVGDAFYPDQNPAGWAQVVLLDRRTLKPVGFANKTFGCDSRFDQPTPDACAKPLREGIKAPGSDELIVVANQPNPDGRPPYGLEWALEPFGVHGGPDAKGRGPGDFSAIATTGGTADWHMAKPRDPLDRSGSMRGWLIRSNEGNYVFAAGRRVGFDTQAKGSTSTENVVQVGDRRFTGRHQGRGPGGFQVVVLDPQTLVGESRTFDTTTEAAKMADYLREANEERPAPLVVVSSIGDPRAIPAGADDAALSRIVDRVAELGGTRGAIYRALDRAFAKKSVSYTLIARGESGPGGGIESEAETGTALNARPLTGTLAPTGANSTYVVADAPGFGPGGGERGPDPSIGASEIVDISLQPPGRWPDAGDPARTAAVGFLGESALGTPDIRAQYWTVPFVGGQFDYGRWSEISKEIGSVAFVPGHGFEPGDLAWAEDELRREIGWLEDEHRYLAALSTPFSKSQLRSWAQLGQIADGIRDKVGVGGDEIANANANAVFDGILSTLTALPTRHIGEAVHAADSIYSAAMELSEINGRKEAGESFQSRADEVGTKMAARFDAAQETLDRQLPNVIASDYEKLRAAGSCSSTRPADWKECPFDHSDWQFTQEDQADAAEALVPATEIWAYGELLPVRYTAWLLPPWWRSLTDRQFSGLGLLGFPVYPFDGEPVAAQSPVPIYRNLPDYGHRTSWDPDARAWHSSGDTWQIRALAFLTGKGRLNDAYVTHFPEASVLEHLFKPSADGGLGVEKETFFDRHFKPRPLAHYPFADGPAPAWCLAETRIGNCP